jgi:hypothetical protein
MLAAAGDETRGLRNRALLAVVYDSLCRRSELVALQRVDLEMAEHGEGTIMIRRSKTLSESDCMIWHGMSCEFNGKLNELPPPSRLRSSGDGFGLT